MKLANHTYYFAKVPEKYQKEYPHDDVTWNPEYYLRIRVDANDEEIKFEDTCDRMVPVCFEYLWEMRETLSRIINDLQKDLVGQPNQRSLF